MLDSVRLGRNLAVVRHQEDRSAGVGVFPEITEDDLRILFVQVPRDFVRQQGLSLITWTYDPLESKNAHLNIMKLGAVCNTYYRDLYGELRDGLQGPVMDEAV